MMTRELRKRETKIADLMQTGLTASEAGKLVYTETPRHIPKRAKAGDKCESNAKESEKKKNDKKLAKETEKKKSDRNCEKLDKETKKNEKKRR
jgi:hypothetical protein